MIGSRSAPFHVFLSDGVPPGVLGPGTFLQTVESEGGSPLVVGLVLASLVLGAVLSLGIAYRLYVGYRGSGDRSMLAIAVGLLLLTTVPTAIRIVVPTTLGGEQALRIASTTVSELVGLLAIVYAVRTPTRTRHRVERTHATMVVPIAVAVAGNLDVVTTAIQAITPVVGSYVTWLAFRGYRRNDSVPMAFLGLGIALLTITPFVTSIVLGQLAGATDALVLLGISVSQLAGLGSIYYSLTRA
jgi:hypothetical protein